MKSPEASNTQETEAISITDIADFVEQAEEDEAQVQGLPLFEPHLTSRAELIEDVMRNSGITRRNNKLFNATRASVSAILVKCKPKKYRGTKRVVNGVPRD